MESGGWSVDFNLVSSLLPHQSLAYRRIQGDFTFLKIHFVRAHYGICHLLPGVQVGELHLAQQRDLVPRERLGVYHSGIFENILKEADPADHLGLGPSGGTVSTVFTEISLGTSLREVVLDLGILDIDKVFQFGDYLVVAFL